MEGFSKKTLRTPVPCKRGCEDIAAGLRHHDLCLLRIYGSFGFGECTFRRAFRGNPKSYADSVNFAGFQIWRAGFREGSLPWSTSLCSSRTVSNIHVEMLLNPEPKSITEPTVTKKCGLLVGAAERREPRLPGTTPRNTNQSKRIHPNDKTTAANNNS